LIFAQADLFGEASADDVEKWTEEVVAEIIGEATVKKRTKPKTKK